MCRFIRDICMGKRSWKVYFDRRPAIICTHIYMSLYTPWYVKEEFCLQAQFHGSHNSKETASNTISAHTRACFSAGHYDSEGGERDSDLDMVGSTKFQ